MRDILDRLKQIEESQTEPSGPQVGDEFGLSFSEDLEISTTITDVLEDGIVVDVDDEALAHIQENGAFLYDGEVFEEELDEGEQHGNSKIYDKCRKGWRKKPGATRGSKGSCIPEDIEEATVDLDKKRDSEKKWIDVARLMADATGKISFKTDAGIELSNDVEKLANAIVSVAPEETPAIGSKTYNMIKNFVAKADMKSDPKEIMSFVDDAVKAWEGGAEWDRSKVKDPNPEMEREDINVDEANESPEERLKALDDLYKNTMDTIKRTENIMYMTPPGPNRDYYEMEIDQMQKHAAKIKKDYQALEAGMKGADNIRAQVSSARAESVEEAEYQGRKVSLGKPTRGDVKKFKVYVRDPKTGNVKKVNFGDPNMKIKKSNPARRKSFRARHNCANPGPRTKARYWSCRKW